MRKTTALFAASLLAAATCAAAQPSGLTRDNADTVGTAAHSQPDGKALFEARCRCHGPQGPKKYRGKNPELVARALRNSKLKTLTSGRMTNVSGLDDEEVDALARYLSTL